MLRHWVWIGACVGLGLSAPGADALEIRYRDQVNKVNAFDPHGVVARRLVAPNSPHLNRLRTYSAPPVQARYKDDVKPNWGALGTMRGTNARPVSPVITTPVAAATASTPGRPAAANGVEDVRAVTGGAVYRKLSEMANTAK